MAVAMSWLRVATSGPLELYERSIGDGHAELDGARRPAEHPQGLEDENKHCEREDPARLQDG